MGDADAAGRRRTAALLVAALLLGWSGSAAALSFAELGEAGQLIATAQAVGGGVDTIEGTLEARSGGDADLYLLELDAGFFEATTVGGSNVDTQLFLFDASGFGIVHNDDAADGVFQSTIVANLLGGTYYLGISGFNLDPVSAGGPIFPDTNNSMGDPVFGPTGTGGGSPLSNWKFGGDSIFGASGDYAIFISPTRPDASNPIPEPSAALAFALGLGIVGGAVRRGRAR